MQFSGFDLIKFVAVNETFLKTVERNADGLNSILYLPNSLKAWQS